METKLKELAEIFSNAQFNYAASSPPIPWERRDKSWKDLMDEIERVENELEKYNEFVGGCMV